MIEEEWKPVMGYEGLYEVSSYGRVRSFKRNPTGKLLKPCPNSMGRLQLILHNSNKEKKSWMIHRLVADHFICKRPEGLVCRHLDGNYLNNVVTNLSWGTITENQRDRLGHGTDSRGEKQANLKLTAKDVLDIRWARTFDFTFQEIADYFGISNSHCDSIVKRKTWSHI